MHLYVLLFQTFFFRMASGTSAKKFPKTACFVHQELPLYRQLKLETFTFSESLKNRLAKARCKGTKAQGLTFVQRKPMLGAGSDGELLRNAEKTPAFEPSLQGAPRKRAPPEPFDPA